MMMLDHGRNKWSGTAFAVWVEGVCALHDAPTVVASAIDQFDHLPEILTDIPDPGLTGVRIETEAPGISKAVGSNLGARALHAYKRVIFRNRIISARVRVIDIEAHHRREQVINALTGPLGSEPLVPSPVVI
jgi:hypothetical protein